MLEKKILFTWTWFGNGHRLSYHPDVWVSGASQGCQESLPSLSHYLHARCRLSATPLPDLWGETADVGVFAGVFLVNSIFI